MNQNPYESTHTTYASGRTRSTRWLVWAGATCIVIALVCVAVAVFGMIYSFHVVAESDSVPRPQDLARGISIATLPSLAAVPFGILGVILLGAGFVIRRTGQCGYVTGGMSSEQATLRVQRNGSIIVTQN